MDLLIALKEGLKRTKSALNLSDFLIGRRLDQKFLDDLEERLFTGDLGIEVTEMLIASLRERTKRGLNTDDLKSMLFDEMVKLFPVSDTQESISKPEVILFVGVNGCGKTTTIGKLAYRYAQEGKKVVVAGADSFRAAAVEQLEMWCGRARARVVKGGQNADPAAIAFDALKSAIAHNEDVLLIDTAGRLQSKSNLMNELEKIVRVLKKLVSSAPHQVYLILDAVIGQNAIEQARVFGEKAGVTALILTKMDGTAKGGSAFAAAKLFNLPIKYLGVGEKIGDLIPFEPEDFVKELLE